MEETEYAFLRSRELRVVLNDGKGIIGFPRTRAEIKVVQPLRFEDHVETELQLGDMDGKQIHYEFVIRGSGQVQATGKFCVACCRFPAGEPPFAILTPEFVEKKLTGC